MRKITSILAILLFGSFLVTGNAMATPLDATAMNLTELQGVFTGIGSTIDVNADESKSEVFQFQSAGATATFVASVSYGGTASLGLYDVNDTSVRLKLVDTSFAAGDDTQIRIELDFTDPNYLVAKSKLGSDDSLIDTAQFSTTAVGFYATWENATGQPTYYSESDLNAASANDLDSANGNDNDHFLTYLGKGESVSIGNNTAVNDAAHWYIAAEVTDMASAQFSDFTDIVVQLESLQPVPEPATMVLFGTGLLGLAALGRKKFLS